MKATSTPKKSIAKKEAMPLLPEEKKYLSSFQNLLLQIPVAIAIFRGSNYIVELANNKALGVMVKDSSFIGKPLFEAMPELEHPIKEILDKVMQTGIPFQANEIELLLFRNGKTETGWFNLDCQPICDDDNTISGILATVNEITEQVLVRKKIEDSEKRYNMMLMKSPFAFAVFKGKNMVITLANDAIKEMWGKGKDLEGKPLFEVLPELKNSEFPGFIDNVYTTGVPFYGEEILAPVIRNGKLEDVYFNFVYQPYLEADETISGVTVIAYEVTAQVTVKKAVEAQHEVEKKALKLVEESELRFRNLIYTSPSAIGILLGEDLVITIANEPIIEILGKGKEIIGKKYFEALPELAEQGYKEVFNQVYTTGIPFSAIETPVSILQNGVTTLKYYNFILYPQKNIHGDINGIGIIATEVTSQAKHNLQIKASEERFRLLAMQAPVAIGVVRGEKYVVEIVNSKILEIWGRTEAQVLDKPIFEVLTELKGQGFEALVDEVYSTGERFVTTELPITLLRNGQLENMYVKFVYEPLREADGTISGVMVLADEITDQVNARKAVEVSEKKFRLLTNNMPQKITNADADGNVLFFNQQWIDDTGLTFDELMAFGWVKAMHPDDLELTVNNWKHSVATGDIFDVECRIQNKEGDYRWHLSRAVPIRDENGKIVMWVGSNTDIHEQKEQKERLQDAVAARTVELSAANEELKKMNKELEAFTYVSSHDLQEPLRKIRTIAGRILEKENQNLSDSGKNYFRLMQNAAERMQTLIQDLLAFSRLSMADRKFENTNINIIIEEVKKEFNEAIAEKNATVEVKGICDVKIIPFQFRQLMHNLIGNALKFSNPNIPPHIIIESQNVPFSNLNITNLPPKKDYCHITVSDNGIGFEKEFAEKIFEVFQKLHSKDEYAGTGIGLAIVKKIVENHNGIITASGELNKGATFDIYLPA